MNILLRLLTGNLLAAGIVLTFNYKPFAGFCFGLGIYCAMLWVEELVGRGEK